MDRRGFLKLGVAGAGAATLGPALLAGALAAPAQPGASPYGPLLPPDQNGIRLPVGFRSRRLATSGQVVPGTSYRWHVAPDGGGTVALPDGGWVYTSNSEAQVKGTGGAGALRFSADGTVVDAYRILSGTMWNCAGGMTPWGTWLSCEEHTAGLVWACDPTRPSQGVAKPALGRFKHEAVAFDPRTTQAYLTEDEPDGLLYRYTPTYPAYPLVAGALEAMVAARDGSVRWVPVPDPTVRNGTLTRYQAPGATRFKGGEGIWYHDRSVYWSVKGDNRIWALRVDEQRIEKIYDAALAPGTPLQGIDNLVIAPNGDLYVAEDSGTGGTMDLCLITQDGVVSQFLRVTKQWQSEIAGPAFDPSGSRLCFSSQRGIDGTGAGITYEVSGPFRHTVPLPAA